MGHADGTLHRKVKADSMGNKYQRETVEFIPVLVTVDGVVVITGVQLAITAVSGVRPTSWSAATVLNGKTGVLVSTPAVGSYKIWAKITSSPEIPVLDCGTYQVV